MANEISQNRNVPVHSMVFGYPLYDAACVDQPGFCLPVYEFKDLKFAIAVNTNSTIYSYYAKVSRICDRTLKTAVDTTDEAHWVQLTQYGGITYGAGNNVVAFEGGNLGWYFGEPNLDDPEEIPSEDPIKCGECFYIQIVKKRISEGTAYTSYACSSCMIRICDPCYTTVIQYRCNEDAFDFKYVIEDGSGGNLLQDFYNSVRLPFYLQNPQFPSKKNVFSLSNGSKKKLSARIEKEYPAQTDWMPEFFHERLAIALEHDHVLMTNENAHVTLTEVMNEGPYDISWPEFRDYPMGQAKFKVKITPYTQFNSNCKDD